jgi:hypothetical protein
MDLGSKIAYADAIEYAKTTNIAIHRSPGGGSAVYAPPRVWTPSLVLDHRMGCDLLAPSGVVPVSSEI